MFSGGWSNGTLAWNRLSAIAKVAVLQTISKYFTGTQPAFTGSKLTIDTLEQGVQYVQSIFIVNFEHISDLVLVFLLLTLSM